MKSLNELQKVLKQYPFSAVNAHVHTHLCDGQPNMTVENLAVEAEKLGIRFIILTPHLKWVKNMLLQWSVRER